MRPWGGRTCSMTPLLVTTTTLTPGADPRTEAVSAAGLDGLSVVARAYRARIPALCCEENSPRLNDRYGPRSLSTPAVPSGALSGGRLPSGGLPGGGPGGWPPQLPEAQPLPFTPTIVKVWETEYGMSPPCRTPSQSHHHVLVAVSVTWPPTASSLLVRVADHPLALVVSVTSPMSPVMDQFGARMAQGLPGLV